MRRISNLLPLLLVLFLAGLTLWLRFAVEKGAPAERAEGSLDPDAMVDKLTLTRLNIAGKPNYVLSALRMAHFPGDDSTELEAPRFAKKGEGPAITITAERGTLDHDSEEAHFYGNVLLVREGAPDRDELRVRTEYLHIIARSDIMRTDKPITISEGRSVLSGVGMELNKQTRRFSILARVRGRFEPPPK
ncbi:MAG: LPS export ABC transporter periplasmic protein LptC [Betaproteobacteria bacterium]|nr:LPS export ABC transporter periplasmic protein LptC [Betaproteobacteria bacterium]